MNNRYEMYVYKLANHVYKIFIYSNYGTFNISTIFEHRSGECSSFQSIWSSLMGELEVWFKLVFTKTN